MKEDWIKQFDIPNMEDLKLEKEETEKAKDLFEKISILMRNECGMFELHIAYHVILKIKEAIVDSMKLNFKSITEEYERRKKDHE